MSTPIPNTTCILAFAIGIGVIFLAYWAVGSLSRWLGAKSRIKERTAKEEGVPVWITGNFERLLAFFLVLLHVEGAYALLEGAEPSAAATVRGSSCLLLAIVGSVSRMT
jgi:hypothetical protein